VEDEADHRACNNKNGHHEGDRFCYLVAGSPLGYEPLPYGDYGVYSTKIGRRKRHIQHIRHRNSFQNGYQKNPSTILKMPVLSGLHHHYFRKAA